MAYDPKTLASSPRQKAYEEEMAAAKKERAEYRHLADGMREGPGPHPEIDWQTWQLTPRDRDWQEWAGIKLEQQQLSDAKEHVHHREFGRWVPAARCRECSTITWEASIRKGRRRTGNPHEEGCTRPPGRFDREEAT
jgi:hypothetical protein